MTNRFNTWKDAHNAAVTLARLIGHDVGILRQDEFGRDGYNIYHLPKPENRFGFELRCEVVGPTTPLSGAVS